MAAATLSENQHDMRKHSSPCTTPVKSEERQQKRVAHLTPANRQAAKLNRTVDTISSDSAQMKFLGNCWFHKRGLKFHQFHSNSGWKTASSSSTWFTPEIFLQRFEHTSPERLNSHWWKFIIKTGDEYTELICGQPHFWERGPRMYSSN